MQVQFQRPTGAFIGAAWCAMAVGAIAYLAGLWNSTMQLNEQGYYFTILMYGLFSAVSCKNPSATAQKVFPLPAFTMACAGHHW
jgi:uncharacterized membrane protein YiaA